VLIQRVDPVWIGAFAIASRIAFSSPSPDHNAGVIRIYVIIVILIAAPITHRLPLGDVGPHCCSEPSAAAMRECLAVDTPMPHPAVGTSVDVPSLRHMGTSEETPTAGQITDWVDSTAGDSASITTASGSSCLRASAMA
jgi:hypothetical protein